MAVLIQIVVAVVDQDPVGTLAEVQIVGAVVVVHKPAALEGPVEGEGPVAWDGLAALGDLAASGELAAPGLLVATKEVLVETKEDHWVEPCCVVVELVKN